MREEIIRKTGEFLRDSMNDYPNLGEDFTRRKADYRIEHSYRVAYIAKEIAEKEGFDPERAFVAGLLHDLGYTVKYETVEEFMDHGRIGARLARPFLLSLGYSEEETNEMCYGIAIHVDDVADFEGERTPLALTIADADNIDRFDAFRIYDGLASVNYRDMPIDEQRAHVDKVLQRLPKLRELPCGTKTGEAMWKEKIDYQISFFQKLKKQIEKSF